jgi:hypothetical protein
MFSSSRASRTRCDGKQECSNVIACVASISSKSDKVYSVSLKGKYVLMLKAVEEDHGFANASLLRTAMVERAVT